MPKDKKGDTMNKALVQCKPVLWQEMRQVVARVKTLFLPRWVRRAPFILMAFFISSACAVAQESTPPQVPEGMEAIQIGGSGWVIVPKGAQTRKVGAQIIVEGTREYMSRRFEEMEARLAHIERAQEAIQKGLESLTELIRTLTGGTAPSGDNQ